MPTGLNNSPGLAAPGSLFPSNIPNKTVNRAPQDAVNVTLTTLIRTTGVPQPATPYQVPPQASVNVRGQNGTTAGNTGPVYVGLNPEELSNGGGRQVTPDTEIFYPVSNAGQIWVRGTAGDGIQVTINANPLY